jgi:hypothetical protein
MALSLTLVATSFAEDGRWDGFSAPEIMSEGFIHHMSTLPLEGTIEIGPKAWSGHYWPSQKGGINHRWNSPAQEGFKYSSPTLEKIKNMSLEELAQLSPAEKYDLYTGKYDYPLKKEAATHASKRADDWAGICHGWAPATLHHNEPTAKTLTNLDGLRIPFGSSDIKALLSYYYAFHYDAESTDQVGKRCFYGNWMGGARGCGNDLNAGALHIILANKLGLERTGFIADVDRYKEVWNQPVVAFKSVILADNLPADLDSASGTVKRMKIATELFYVDESDAPTWNIVHGTKDQIISKRDLVYFLEINSDGFIIGGDWISDERPDFLWNKPKAPSFEGILGRLPELLND